MRYARPRTSTRALTVLAAPVVAVAAWILLRLGGIDLVTDDGRAVGAASVVVVAALAALAGWAVVALLERRTRRPALWWGLAASAAFSVSALGPDHTASGLTLLGLLVLHFVTYVVVIGGMGLSLGRPVLGSGRP